MLFCSVLCCAVLCCAVLCCAVLCCAVLCCAAVCIAFSSLLLNHISFIITSHLHNQLLSPDLLFFISYSLYQPCTHLSLFLAPPYSFSSSLPFPSSNFQVPNYFFFLLTSYDFSFCLFLRLLSSPPLIIIC